VRVLEILRLERCRGKGVEEKEQEKVKKKKSINSGGAATYDGRSPRRRPQPWPESLASRRRRRATEEREESFCGDR